MTNALHGARARWRSGCGLAAALALTAGCAATTVSESAMSDAAGPTVPVSVNAIMVYLTDPAAHEIWDRNYATEPLSDHDWTLVEQHGNNLAASTTLIAMGGTGAADQTWVRSADWRRLTQALQDGAFAAVAAADARDQEQLDRAGDAILETCQSCHELFKPSLPTEGITHIPHGDPAYGG